MASKTYHSVKRGIRINFECGCFADVTKHADMNHVELVYGCCDEHEPPEPTFGELIQRSSLIGRVVKEIKEV